MSNTRTGNVFYQGESVKVRHVAIAASGTTAETIVTPFTTIFNVLFSNGGGSGTADSNPTWTASGGTITTGSLATDASYVVTIIGF